MKQPLVAPPRPRRAGVARLRDGALVPFRVHGRQGARRILLYNGLVSSDLHWRAFVEHFARTHEVITWDYRGHGPYERPPAGTVGIEAFASDGHDVLVAAGGGPAILAGLSMGVQTVLAHWAQHPEDAAGLVLLCGTYGHPLDRLGLGERGRRAVAAIVRGMARVGRAGRVVLWPFLGTRLGAEVAFWTGGADRERLPEGFFSELFAHVLQMHPETMAEIVASWVQHSAEDALDSISVPTLIFAGGADQLTPPSRSEHMSARIRDAELHVVPGHTHLLQVERPDLVHPTVEGWLARHGL